MADPTNESPAPVLQKARFKKASTVFLILLTALLLMGAAGFVYIQWMKLTTTFTGRINQVRQMTAAQQSAIEKLQQTTNELQQSVQQSTAMVVQQAETIRDIQGVQKGHFDAWRAAEAAYLVRLANDHLEFIHDMQSVLALLQRADTVLQAAEDPALLALHQAIIADIARLKAIPSVDITLLYPQLTALNDQLDQLPLLLPTENKPAAGAETKMPVSWWQAGLNQTLAVLKKIVIVHYQEPGRVPLILPQERALLYQNLHAQMDNVIWGAMYRQPLIYDASLDRLITWIKRYADLASPQTKAILHTLQTLKAEPIRPPAENLNTTLQQFDDYFSAQNKLMTQALLGRQTADILTKPVQG